MHTTYVFYVNYSPNFVHKYTHNQNIQEQQEQRNDYNMSKCEGKDVMKVKRKNEERGCID